MAETIAAGQRVDMTADCETGNSSVDAVKYSRAYAEPAQQAKRDHRGLKMDTLEEVWRFAKYVVAGGMAPPVKKDQPATAEAIVVTIQFGLEVGLTPMQAVQNIYVVNNRPTLYGDAMLALCMTSPAFDHGKFKEEARGEPYHDDYKAVCTACRIGAQPVVRAFSVDDAKKAGLLNKPGPWTNHPKRMLQMRARSWALRDSFPDALKGLVLPDEVDQVLSQLDLGETEPDSGMTAVEQLTRKLVPQPPPAPPNETMTKGAPPKTDHSQPEQPPETEEQENNKLRCVQLKANIKQVYNGLTLKRRTEWLAAENMNLYPDINRLTRWEDLQDLLTSIRGFAKGAENADQKPAT